jgi:putative endonuclease
MIECNDKSLYTGCTNNIEKRLKEHTAGRGSKFVRSRKPNKIVYSEEFEGKCEALKREREIKGYSRQKKLALLK